MTGTSKRTGTFMPMVFAAALMPATLFSYAASADGMTEAKTAATHAGLAAAGTDLKTVHMHLHHALNCLVGPKGDGYDSSEIDPCKNAGSGAIPDTTDAAKKKTLETAAASARAGIAASDLTASQKDAKKTEATLKTLK